MCGPRPAPHPRVGVNFALAGAKSGSDRADGLAIDGDIGHALGRAGSVDEHGVAYDYIMHD